MTQTLTPEFWDKQIKDAKWQVTYHTQKLQEAAWNLQACEANRDLSVAKQSNIPVCEPITDTINMPDPEQWLPLT
jgi:hypothetical protein